MPKAPATMLDKPDSVAELSAARLHENEALTRSTRIEENGHPQRWLTLPILLVATFLLSVDFSIVNVALPSIRDSLGATGGQLQLIIAFYMVAYAAFLITGGRLGDLLGRKTMFIGGMAGFILASAACGFAPSIHVLIAGRLLQGLAAAAMAPQVVATIRIIFPHHERSRALGYYGAATGLGVVLGQLLGGLLIGLHPWGCTWPAIFLVNLPVGALDLVLAALLLPGTKRLRGVGLDVPGAAVLSIGLVLLVYPLADGRETGWPVWMLLCLALSVPVLALFVFLEHRLLRLGGSPLLNLSLFKERSFSIGLMLALMVYASSAPFFFSYAIYLESGLGWDVMQAGLGALPFGAAFFFGSLAVSYLIRRLGHGAPMLGYVLGIVGQGTTIVILLRGGGPGTLMYVAVGCAGLGLGVVVPSLVRIVLDDISPAHAGTAAGAMTTAFFIGAAVAVPLIGGVFFFVLGDATNIGAYQHAFAAVLSCVVATFIVSLGLTKLLHPSR